MNDHIDDLSRYRLQKAQEDLISARLLLDNGHINQSINRSYYAIFHAVRSLLAYDMFDSKKHSGIIAFFNQNYIKTGKIPVEYFKIITGAETIRHDSDYDDFFIASAEQAQIQYENAVKFIDMIKLYINKNYQQQV